MGPADTQVAVVAALVVLAGVTLRVTLLFGAGMEVLECNPTSMEPQCFSAAVAVVIPNMLLMIYDREALGVQVAVGMAFKNLVAHIRLFLLLMAQSILAGAGAGAGAEVDLLTIR